MTINNTTQLKENKPCCKGHAHTEEKQNSELVASCSEHNHSHEHKHHSHEHEHEHNHHPDEGGCCGADNFIPIDPKKSILKKEVPQGFNRSQWRIDAMDCPVEEGMIRRQLSGMKEVDEVEFNLIQRTLTAIHTQGSDDKIVAAIADLGMEALTVTGEEEFKPDTQKQKRTLYLAVAGLGLALVAEGMHFAGYAAIFSAIPALIAIALCGLGTYKKGWIAIRHGELNINALMSIAVTGAMIIGQWPEAAMVMALFTISELIEARSLDRARMAIRGLLQLAPDTILIQQANGTWAEVAPKEAQLGDIVRVRPGARIALDGTITNGQTTINQSAVTGESLPIDKTVGDPVYAGTLNTSGEFEFSVTATAQNSTLARIIHAIEEAQSERAPTQRFVDQFARYYTPAVVLGAFLFAVIPPLFFGQEWLPYIYKALVILVIACPCALVISTPVTIVSALTAASRRGLLVKGGVYMENGRFLRWLALDKTGTITHGKPVQTEFHLLNEQQAANEIRGIAASLASRSDHPVSMAIAQAAEKDEIALQEVQDFEAVMGQGTRATINGVSYHLGNLRMSQEQNILTPESEAQIIALERKGQTVVALGTKEKILALFAVADTIKPTSQQAIKTLHQMGVNTLILTGDNPHTALAIAEQAGIDEARGNQLPDDKRLALEEKIKALKESGDKHGMVAMVGDGINDAPALARADIGFAMGVMGTDTAMETADVAIMDDDLRKIPEFIQLSKRTHAILIQNITLALGIKVIFLAITLFASGTMWMAVFADVGASLLVVANGLRMLRQSPTAQTNPSDVEMEPHEAFV